MTDQDRAGDQAGEKFNINRDWLRLMNSVTTGRVTRSAESDRDQLRRGGKTAFNDNLGNKMKKLQAAGLAELPATNIWALTALGERRRAATEAAYAARRISAAA